MNMNKLFRRPIGLGSVLILLGLPLLGSAQADVDRLFVFGDSLSDAGNVWQLTGQVSQAPYAIIPSAPYAIGGHHFSNGKTWAERLSQDLQSNSSGKASLAGPGKNGNYAFGGARARLNSPSPSPSSAIQVQLFLGDYGTAPASATYVVQFGGNDLRDALIAGAPGTPAAQAAMFAIMQAAVTETAASVRSLYGAGARKFLVANAPNLEHAPAVILSGASAAAGFLTGIYNGMLEGALQGLELEFPDASIRRLDLAGFINDVVANPAAYGIVNTSSPCLLFMTESDAKCENPQEYLFWDGIHPTAAAHEALARAAASAID
jgi:outer membrane lipase/esterase